MKVRILGAQGGVTKNDQATSYLINDELLIDAGSIVSNSDISMQVALKHILISHCHLDHIKDLAFLCDNCFGMRQSPFDVYSDPKVIKSIKDHFFNDIIWPDFSVLPSKEKPTISFHSIYSEKIFQLDKYEILPIHVNHPGPGLGFIISDGEVELLFTQDTGPTERIWKAAKKCKNLKAIFTEVSFPNHLKKVAIDSFHHTPETLSEEIEKMPPHVPIYLGHLKPNFYQALTEEISDIMKAKIQILKDGELLEFT